MFKTDYEKEWQPYPVGRVRDREETWAGEEGEIMNELRGRGPSAIWHHGGWNTAAALDLPSSLHSTVVCEWGCRFMAEWVKDEEKASEHRQRKREAEEVDKGEAAPG